MILNVMILEWWT